MAQAIDETRLERAIEKRGSALFAAARQAGPARWSAEHYTDKLIGWAMENEACRTALFRFVDVLPSLSTPAAIVRHLQEYFEPLADQIPELVQLGLRVKPESLPARAVARAVTRQVRALAQRFILGADPVAALPALRAIEQEGRSFTVDLLGEATLGEAEAAAYQQRYLDLIRVLHQHFAAPNISVKLSALSPRARAIHFDEAVAILTQRLSAIVRAAQASGCFVYVDMEDTAYTDLTLATCRSVFGSDEFRAVTQGGIVLQAYLRRTERDLREWLSWLDQRGAPLAVRLVKGAYWDTELIHARLRNWPVPVWQEKAATDAAYENLSRLLIDHAPLVFPAFASHNLRSLCHAIEYAAARGLATEAYEIQVLYGMADPIKRPLVEQGYAVREYAPIGELIPGMGYLVRRLLENTSNQGFVRLGFHEHETPHALLQKPEPSGATVPEPIGFQNAPLLDFTIAENRTKVAKAIAAYRPKRKPAEASSAEAALEKLHEFFPAWRNTPVDERATVLERTAAILEQRRTELIAVMVHETAKPWAEADADVCEAVDYLRYYARQARALFKPRRLGDLPGEENTRLVEPRGVSAVIAPWNFPLAIPCGMMSAALVTGNCVALKPAEQSTEVAGHLFAAFAAAGLPQGAAAFLPGAGETIGAALVNSRLVSTIAFTGSKAVGLEIIAAAARCLPGQEHVKRVIAEMGSKNAIVIDADADLDAAVAGVVESAFRYAGQKCSACARAIVVADVYDRFVTRLVDATRSLVVGPATDPGTDVPPVIDDEAAERLRAVLAEAKASCRLLAQARGPASGDRLIPPAVFAEVPVDHPLRCRELFGPLLAVERADSFGAALERAQDTEYGLTGAVFSRSPRHLQQAIDTFRVGNLYLNRGCTGAIVGRQPFGGAKLSGVGSKAGGPDYLQQFVIPRTVCESTVRNGFAPHVGDAER